MKERITDILCEVKAKISMAASENELQGVKNAYIGRQGALSLLMKELPDLIPELRPEMGTRLNQAKNQIKIHMSSQCSKEKSGTRSFTGSHINS